MEGNTYTHSERGPVCMEILNNRDEKWGCWAHGLINFVGGDGGQETSSRCQSAPIISGWRAFFLVTDWACLLPLSKHLHLYWSAFATEALILRLEFSSMILTLEIAGFPSQK